MKFCLFCIKPISREVKSTNILINENIVTKVADLGLLKSGSKDKAVDHVSRTVKGTLGVVYLKPYFSYPIQRLFYRHLHPLFSSSSSAMTGTPAIDDSSSSVSKTPFHPAFNFNNIRNTIPVILE
uniref:Protein kinase domain-containing protein n=1 Tax=Lactuca sativa TaxID=4236 RepID=A0A9R1XFA6_LACSA|nr:hypothetical protein LSAT_V11C400222510 [Lactuca sativa]